MCDAFGHWTYQATDGCVLVTDVQGWFNQDEKRVYLTDPCVHCSRPNLMDDQFKDGGLIGEHKEKKERNYALGRELRKDAVRR